MNTKPLKTAPGLSF